MENLNQIIKILNSLNPILFVGLLSALVTLFVLTMNNEWSNKRLDKQFENDRAVNAKDREMDLRKEIFLEATVVMATGVNTLVKFTNLDLSDSEVINDYVEKSPVLVKLNLIANMETITAFANFNTEISTLFLKYYSKRASLINDKNAILFWEKELLKNETEKTSILELMKQLNIEGIVDDRKWHMYDQNYAFAEKARIQSLEKIDEITDELKPKKINLIRECMSDIAHLAAFQISILTSTRSELELNFDEARFKNIMNEAINKNLNILNTYLGIN